MSTATPLPRGIALAALECIRQEYEPGTMAHDTAHKAIDDYHAAIRANAALAAREPHAADGNAPELRITDCSAHGDALHIQVNTGHNWLCAVALTAILAEYEPQPEEPAPGELASCISELADELEAEASASGGWEAHAKRDAAERMRRRIAAEQPAPELADARPDLGTAWRLLNETREQLAAIRKGIAELAADITASAAATRPSRKSQIEDECAIALRKLLEDQ